MFTTIQVDLVQFHGCDGFGNVLTTTLHGKHANNINFSFLLHDVTKM
jgi:hypothetical protein